MEEYSLDKKYFEVLMGSFSRTLCGKTMKKFEIISDRETLKLAVKETIYEECRGLKQLLDAHSAGYERVEWKFKTTKGMEK
jgi:hypothetical protein